MYARRAATGLLAFALVVGPSAGPAAAWSPAGHMVLGAVAYRELQRIDPEALAAVLELLERHPHHGRLLDPPADRELEPETRRVALFMRAARWADDVRQPPYDEYSRPTWHYVNFRYHPPDELRPPRGPQRDGHLLWALEENVRRLDSDSETVRAVALTWLFHLVTDLHNPLHNIALIDATRPDGDRGGNLTFVRVDAEAATIDLHWLWDDLIHRSDTVATSLARAAELPASAVPASEPAGDPPTARDFRAWSEHGARVAVERAYLHGALPAGAEEQGAILPADYLPRAREVAEQQAVLGARRLAQLLAAVF